jgi:hypothetical protein
MGIVHYSTMQLNLTDLKLSNFQPPPDSPIFGRLKLKMKKEKFKMLLGLATSIKGFGRASHPFGVGGVGEVKIVDNPKFPEHEFFSAG